MKYKITTPILGDELKDLRAGDPVLLSGIVYTARDAAHKRLTELMARGQPLPIDLRGCALYYVGPSPERPGQVIGSAGPTTSGRMDPYTPALLDLGMKLIIGKGRRSPAVAEAIARNGALYLAATGGAGALLSACVKRARVVCYEDLGCEAVRELLVEDMPLTVAIDSQGGDIYSLGPAAYLAGLKNTKG